MDRKYEEYDVFYFHYGTRNLSINYNMFEWPNIIWYERTFPDGTIGSFKQYKTFERLEQGLLTHNALLNEINQSGKYDIQYANEYAEPGYTLDNEERPILFANWNEKSRYDQETKTRIMIDDTMPRLAEILEHYGYSIEWSDEWITCECGKAFRTSPDCYSWTMYGYIGDGWYLCGDCIVDDPESYLEDIEGDPRKAITISGIDPTEHGYKLVNEDSYQSGFYGGQNDSPDKIAKDLESKGIDRFIFDIDSVGQFDCHFSLYVHEDQYHLLKDQDIDSKGKDPAVEVKKQFDLINKIGHNAEPGIYTDKNTGASVEVKHINPEDFVKGKM